MGRFVIILGKLKDGVLDPFSNFIKHFLTGLHSLEGRFRLLIVLMLLVMLFLCLQAVLTLTLNGRAIARGKDLAKVYLPEIETLGQMEADFLSYHVLNLEVIFAKSTEQMAEKTNQSKLYLEKATANMNWLRDFSVDLKLKLLLDQLAGDVNKYRASMEKVHTLIRLEKPVESLEVFDKECPASYQAMKSRLRLIREELSRVSGAAADSAVQVLEQARIVAVIVSFCGAFFALLSLGGVNLWRDLKIVVGKIQQSEAELSTKNQQVSSSINYAERIQRTVLHGLEDLADTKLETFMIFRPKDVVSGDFNWFSVQDSCSVLAAVDCSGHGVPGAFMSLIGHLLLKETIANVTTLDPANILNLYHKLVYDVLRQHKKASVHDTIDICLCVYDREKQTMRFAGAKRPLYYRIPGKELSEIKGDRFSVGGDQATARSFNTHVVPCEPGMVFFLTTDGIADQPNEDGRRLGSSHLKHMLMGLYGVSLANYEAQFARNFARHQGSADQRDDITLIGVRPLF